MKITINRFAVGLDTGTFSAISIDGKFFCFGLEPITPVIPVGEWPISFVDSPTWTPKMKCGMPWINWKIPGPVAQGDYNSPQNDGGHTLIHPGNTIKDTSGCILPGAPSIDYTNVLSKPIGVNHSRDTWQLLYDKINVALMRGSVTAVITEPTTL